MARKRIYIAYTGGTIGMQKSAQGYIPKTGYFTDSINQMPEFKRPEMPLFDIHEYSPLIDSANMSPADWQKIANDIKRNYDDYDGFIVLHGTDTMAFTASALSFMFDGLSKPIIVTGSQIPLSELRSDGQVNLLNSLLIAANYPISEVGLFFNNKLYRGNRTTKVHADGFGAFASSNYPELINAGINIQLINGKLIDPNAQAKVTTLAQIQPQPVGVVDLYPGISTQVIGHVIEQPVKALIIQSYGVGNAPQNKDFLKLLTEASDSGIIIVNRTQCLQGSVNMAGYATGNALRDCGVVSGYDMTLEATLTKLHYLLSLGLETDEIKRLMDKSLRGELSKA
ncbi:MAG: L-asparaginase [Phenylobacterium sp.]|jgi:L-asparaginase